MAKRIFDRVDENTSSTLDSVRMMKSEMPKKVNKKVTIIVSIIALILVGVACTCLAFAGKENHEDNQIVEMWTDIANIATPSDDETKTGNTTSVSPEDDYDDIEGNENYIVTHEAYSRHPMARVIDWDALKKINSDVLAWIYIPNTNIDYPIMQEQEYGKAFYLTHNIYKTAQKSGAIFTPKEQSDTDVDMHMQIYGHHMRRGIMFGTLTQYKDEEFLKEHPYIYIYYPDRTEKWGVWTMEHVKDNDKVYLVPYTYDTIEYEELLRYLEDKSLYETEHFGVNNKTRTITLSTCDNGSSDGALGRFVVNAVLLDTVSPGKDIKAEPAENPLAPEKTNSNVILSDDVDYEGYTVNEADTVDDGEVIQFESNE